jgi:DMSO/TMAO reductase YedYZ molybdopterin-dependent catalytic subunit
MRGGRRNENLGMERSRVAGCCPEAELYRGREETIVMSLTRGFSGRWSGNRDRRLPPGQYDIGADWPVLTAEPTPRLDTATWTFKVEGLVRNPVTWTWDEIRALPRSSFEGDIHCVTAWSKLGITFTGVSVDTLLAIAGPLDTATHVLAHSHTGYTTNLPLEDVVDGQAWVAWEVDGRPLPREHGGPARLVVPHLYFWKSAKWVSGLRLLDHDELGFWEVRGYHNHGDPWREQRYDGD